MGKKPILFSGLQWCRLQVNKPAICCLVVSLMVCFAQTSFSQRAFAQATANHSASATVPVAAPARISTNALALAALTITHESVRYDGRYYAIAYPNGDVPANVGVCTDVVIRAYRLMGVDLQQQVHEDMNNNFSLYPSKKLWGLNKPDTNIDHRRVPNLQVFFRRHGKALPITQTASDYLPGDLVTWMLPGNLPHIGIVIPAQNAASERPWVVHNIGRGQVAEDVLFDYKITGHFRYFPSNNIE